MEFFEMRLFWGLIFGDTPRAVSGAVSTLRDVGWVLFLEDSFCIVSLFFDKFPSSLDISHVHTM